MQILMSRHDAKGREWCQMGLGISGIKEETYNTSFDTNESMSFKVADSVEPVTLLLEGDLEVVPGDGTKNFWSRLFAGLLGKRPPRFHFRASSGAIERQGGTGKATVMAADGTKMIFVITIDKAREPGQGGFRSVLSSEHEIDPGDKQ